MKRLTLLVLLCLLLAGCNLLSGKPAAHSSRPLVASNDEATAAPESASKPDATDTATPDPFPHVFFEKPSDSIPDEAPGGQNGEFMADQRYAYFEQMICVDYIDFRSAPSYDQPVSGWARYGDVVRVHERQGTWAMVNGPYWIELKNLCDFPEVPDD